MLNNHQRTKLARQALRGSLEIRKRSGLLKSEPVCVYDLAERLGVEVRFCPGNSFEGAYIKPSRTILIPSHRPPGRRGFSCAHELGHWFYGHGTRIDELHLNEQNLSVDSEERLADSFAAYLLMPPWAVKEAFVRRNWNIAACIPLQVYIIAVQLGVGYETLVQHLRWSLHLISDSHALDLLKTTPGQLRRSLLRNDHGRHLIIADLEWIRVPIDLQVGDTAILPVKVKLEGENVDVIGHHQLGLIVRGSTPGITTAISKDESWTAFIRVSRPYFEGRSVYRHLEDSDVNQTTGTDH